jgi:hypothetical protein
MSKLKSPQEKKTASLDHDRRNAYGENDKASRKLIPRGKQQAHQAERRAVNQPLAQAKNVKDEDDLVSTELRARTQAIQKRRNSFRKDPDRPLRDVLTRKETGRWPINTR